MNNKYKRKKHNSKTKLPENALWLDFACALCFAVGTGCFYTVVLMPLGALLFLAGIILPFAAIICAVCALCHGKKNIGVRGIVFSVIAIILPLIAVAVVITLFSTGVAYIRWM